MTDNERKILTLLSKQGPLTKRELTAKGGMSWATAVKMVNRLHEGGFLQAIGTIPSSGRKRSYVYDLCLDHPLAIGIDVEYSTTTMILANLKNDVTVSEVVPTIQKSTSKEILNFLSKKTSDFITRHINQRSTLCGIGIGIPFRIFSYRLETFTEIANALCRHFEHKVYIDNNVRAYTMYMKWAGKAFGYNNFILVSIRTGIGTGIYYQGNLFRGDQGLAGELGHVQVKEEG